MHLLILSTYHIVILLSFYFWRAGGSYAFHSPAPVLLRKQELLADSARGSDGGGENSSVDQEGIKRCVSMYRGISY
jgi:hypothetical protein